MRRIVRTELSRREWLRRARHCEMMAEFTSFPDDAAYALDPLLYRSLAIVAAPGDGPPDGPNDADLV